MNALERTNRKIRNRNRALSACMAGSCLFVFSGLDFTTVETTISSLFVAVPSAGYAAFSFGALYVYANKLKQGYLKSLPSQAKAQLQTLKALENDHRDQKLAKKMTSDLNHVRGADDKVYSEPPVALDAKSSSLSHALGRQLLVINQMAYKGDKAERSFALSHGIAKQKYEEQEARADFHHGVSQVFNFASRWFLIPLMTYVFIPVSDWMQKAVLNVADPHTSEFLNNAVAVSSQFNWYALSALAGVAFFIRGSLLRNVTHACDLQAVRACKSTDGAKKLISKQTRQHFIWEENYLSKDFNWLSDNIKPLAPVFNAMSSAYENIPNMPIPRKVNVLNYLRMSINAMLSIGQNKNPAPEKRIALIEKFASETGLTKVVKEETLCQDAGETKENQMSGEEPVPEAVLLKTAPPKLPPATPA